MCIVLCNYVDVHLSSGSSMHAITNLILSDCMQTDSGLWLAAWCPSNLQTSAVATVDCEGAYCFVRCTAGELVEVQCVKGTVGACSGNQVDEDQCVVTYHWSLNNVCGCE